MNNIIKTSILLFLFSCNLLFSQSNEALRESVLRDAKITSNATLNFDFKTVLEHTYPSVVELMGGEEKALELLKSTFEGMSSQGFIFEKADIINLSEIVFEQNQYRCYVEGYNQIKMPGMRIKSKSYLLGIYDNKHEKWWFIEAKQLKNAALIDQVLPDFNTNLKIPDDDVQTETLKE